MCPSSRSRDRPDHLHVIDHFDKSQLNAEFHKDKSKKRALLAATRAIKRGEEIYASYGESYWTSRGIDPATGKPLPEALRTQMAAASAQQQQRQDSKR